MPERYKKIWMWALYSTLFVLVLCLQTVLFGHARFFGTKLAFLPMIAALVAMFQGKERGGIFGLSCGLLCAFSGCDGGALSIVIYTAIGLGIGFLCEQYLTNQLLSGVLVCAASLLFSQGLLLAFKQFLGLVGFPAVFPMLLQTVLSLPAGIPLYFAVRAIAKLYRPKTI